MVEIDLESLSEAEVRELHQKVTKRLSDILDDKEIKGFKDVTVILGLDESEFQGPAEKFDKWAEKQIGKLNENDREIVKVSIHDMILVACPDDGYKGREWYYTIDFKDAFHGNKDGKFFKFQSYDYYNDMGHFLPPLPGKARWSHDCENSFSLIDFTHTQLKKYVAKQYPFLELVEHQY